MHQQNEQYDGNKKHASFMIIFGAGAWGLVRKGLAKQGEMRMESRQACRGKGRQTGLER